MRAASGLIDRSALRQRAEQVWALLGGPAAVEAPVRELGPSVQQVVDVARALAFKARVVIMDEPTAALTQQETQRLFEIIRGLKQRGAAVIYISHDLEEIFEIADRVTVLRDGKLVAYAAGRRGDESDLIRMMIGRDIDERARPPDRRRAARYSRSPCAICGGGLDLDGVEPDGSRGRDRRHCRPGRLRPHRAAARDLRRRSSRRRRNVAAGTALRATLADRGQQAAGVGFVPEDRKLEGLVAGFLDQPESRRCPTIGHRVGRAALARPASGGRVSHRRW